MSDTVYRTGLEGVVAGENAITYDLGPKLDAYRRNGVQEYLVWRVLDEEVDRFVLAEGEYGPLAPNESGVLKSRVFPGLWLNGPALLAGDLASVVQTLQAGIASPEHQQFAAELRGRIESSSS
jgi:hypothetical protein